MVASFQGVTSLWAVNAARYVDVEPGQERSLKGVIERWTPRLGDVSLKAARRGAASPPQALRSQVPR